MPQIIRSRRRTLALIVTEDAELIIRAPHRLPEREIHNFIQLKKQWIERKISQIEKRPKRISLTKAEEQQYFDLAIQRIIPRSQYWINMTGLKPKSIKISRAKKRWGSCSRQGRINLSWRLILKPQEVIDYVIVHELVHLAHPNHSKKFWQRVGDIMPDCRERRGRLSIT